MLEDDVGARIEEVIQPILHDHGLEVVELEWRPRRPRGVLRVFVDKPGGVQIGDCERVSREIGDLLDVSGLIASAYDLEVSSPGLDRPLRTEREYRWAVGKNVRCWLMGGREVRGRLEVVDAERLVVDGETVPRPEVTRTRLEPEVPWQRRG